MSSTRQQIIDAAITLIADRGFTATSVDDIAEVAGVAKGSVYYNFGSKADLFEAVLTEPMKRLTARLRDDSAGLTGSEALAAVIESLLLQIQEHPAVAKVVVAEMFRIGRDWQESIRLVREEAMGVFADAIAGLAAEGRGPRRNGRAVDGWVVAASVFGAVVVAGLEWLAFQPELAADEVLAGVLATVGALVG